MGAACLKLFVPPWAQTTCTHPPFTFNGGVRSAAWDSCMAQNLTRTIDSGAMQLPACACKPCVHRRYERPSFPKLSALSCGAVGDRFMHLSAAYCDEQAGAQQRRMSAATKSV